MITGEADALVGAWILDQYRIVRVLAQGGMGRVYLAEQADMDRHAAIKILSSQEGAPREWRSRFRCEARAASRLAHPNIVTVYNFGELADGSLFLAMEYVEGVTLGALLARGPMSLRRALRIGRQCAAALAHAHAKGVVHRDFKPENVMVMREGSDDLAKVVDFGVARLSEESDLTQTGALVGTPRYLSPEQCRGETATPKSDAYALGLVLYELLTGEPAIVSDSAYGYLHVHQNVIPGPPSTRRPEPALKPLDAIVMQLLAKDPARRPADLMEVCRALDTARTADGGDSLPWLAADDESGDATLPGGVFAPGLSDSPAANSLPRRVACVGARMPWSAAAQSALAARGLWLHGGDTGVVADMEGEPDLWLAALPPVSWEAAWAALQGGLPAPRGLVCIDAPTDWEGIGARAAQLKHVLIGPYPVDPLAVGIALDWIHHNERGGVEHILSERAIQVVQITSLSAKSACVDALIEDARSEGVRRPALHALAEIAEEMVMNALFHSPRARGRQRPDARGSDTAGLERITLRPGEEATMRWLVTDAFVAVSVRDAFGSLTAEEILTRVSGGSFEPDLAGEHGGAGMGLRIVSRAARHLFFAISPGAWCEVLALVDREPRGGERTLCVLQQLGRATRSIGDRLRLVERREREVTVLQLCGEVNETSDLRAVFRQKGPVRLDLSQVERVNSMGIRAWFEAAREADAELRLTFERCSVAWVRQMNLMPAFCAMGEIESVMAPYFCPRCQTEQPEELRVETLEPTRPPPGRSCRSCGGDLEFDGDAAEYFVFLPA